MLFASDKDTSKLTVLIGAALAIATSAMEVAGAAISQYVMKNLHYRRHRFYCHWHLDLGEA
jgi:hypothetical protein